MGFGIEFQMLGQLSLKDIHRPNDNNSLESLDYQGRLREWERDAGANWLHLQRSWEHTNS